MFVPHQPWLLGNEYHSICYCESEIIWAILLVQGKNRPQEKLTEKFTDLTICDITLLIA